MNARPINRDTNHMTGKGGGGRGSGVWFVGCGGGGRGGGCPFKPRYRNQATQDGRPTAAKQRPAARGNKNVNWPSNMQFCWP